MAVLWSWAFGSEGKSPLSAALGFRFGVGGGTQAAYTVVDNVYSYASFPGTKYSWGTSAARNIIFPHVAPTAGRISAAIKAKTSWRGGYNLLRVSGNANSGDVQVFFQVSNSAASAITCYVDNQIAATITLTLDDWHYLCISYDFGAASVNTVTGTFFVDGAQVATGSATKTTTGVTGAIYESGGFSNTLGLTAQVIAYDTGTSEVDASTPRFVSRLAPNSDTSDAGVWSPASGGTNQVAVTAGAYNNATSVVDAAPGLGDNVVTEINNLSTQLGLTPGLVLGATNHTYSSGTNIRAKASIRDSGGSYVDGVIVTPDENDTTYAYSTVSSGLTGSSTINVKYEVV